MNIKIFKFYHLPFRSPHLNKNVHVPFYIGDPNKNIGNWLMDVNYKNNIHDLNPKLNEFTGIYCVLNNFEAICDDLKIDPNKIDFFGFEHYRRLFDINLLTTKIDILINNYSDSYRWAKRYRLLSEYLIPFFKEFDCRKNLIAYSESFVIRTKYFLELKDYVNKIYDILKNAINNKEKEYFRYSYIIYDERRYMIRNLSRSFGFLTELLVGTIIQYMIEKYNMKISRDRSYYMRKDI